MCELRKPTELNPKPECGIHSSSLSLGKEGKDNPAIRLLSTSWMIKCPLSFTHKRKNNWLVSFINLTPGRVAGVVTVPKGDLNRQTNKKLVQCCWDQLWQVDYCHGVHAVRPIWQQPVPNRVLSALLMLPPTYILINTMRVEPLHFPLSVLLRSRVC